MKFVHASEGAQCLDCKNAFKRKSRFLTPADTAIERNRLNEAAKTMEGRESWRCGGLHDYLSLKDETGRVPSQIKEKVSASKSNAWKGEEMGPCFFPPDKWKLVFKREPHPDMIKDHFLPALGIRRGIVDDPPLELPRLPPGCIQLSRELKEKAKTSMELVSADNARDEKEMKDAWAVANARVNRPMERSVFVDEKGDRTAAMTAAEQQQQAEKDAQAKADYEKQKLEEPELYGDDDSLLQEFFQGSTEAAPSRKAGGRGAGAGRSGSRGSSRGSGGRGGGAGHRHSRGRGAVTLPGGSGDGSEGGWSIGSIGSPQA